MIQMSEWFKGFLIGCMAVTVGILFGLFLAGLR